MTPNEFYELAKQRPRINAFAATCQSCLETGWWKSELWSHAFNGAGLKAGRSWKGTVYDVVSPEQSRDGTMYKKLSSFRKYPDAKAFLADYETKIGDMYPLCVKRRDNFLGYFDGLVSGKYKWATALDYVPKLIAMSVKLAPLIFKDDAPDKLQNSLIYALRYNLLAPANAAAAIKIIKKEVA